MLGLRHLDRLVSQSFSRASWVCVCLFGERLAGCEMMAFAGSKYGIVC